MGRDLTALKNRPKANHGGKSGAHFRIHSVGVLNVHMIEPRQSLRVLCADDNLLVLDMLAKTLESAGHEVEVVTDGRAAISRLTEDPDYFHLIVTDTRMPKLDGFGLVEEARSAGFGGRIIVFANALSAEDRQRYADLRVDRVIDKPGKAGELVGAINELHGSPA
jgi:two-component system cell cycle response regulator CpdR